MKTCIYAFILIFVSMLFAVPAFAGETNAVQSVEPQTGVQLANKFGDKLDQYLGVLAQKVGVAADHFYPIFVKQQYITGIFELSVMAMGSLITIFCIWNGVQKLKNEEDRYAVEKMTTSFVIATIIGIIVLVSIMIQGSTSLGKVCNPEYSAAQELIHMVK